MHKKRQLVHKTVKKTKRRKKDTNEGERIIRTRYGTLVKKPDRLMY